MRRAAIAISLMFVAASAQAQVPSQCASLSQAMPVQPTVFAPVAEELVTPRHQLGAPSGVLAQAFDEALSVDQVLLRIRIEACTATAMATPPASPGTLPASTDPAAYKPQTQYDNTPWRFDMNQNGKRMTADEFSAWMEARGVRVAKGARSLLRAGRCRAGYYPPAEVAPGTPPAVEAPVAPPQAPKVQ